jgi:hypothetical protein
MVYAQPAATPGASKNLERGLAEVSGARSGRRDSALLSAREHADERTKDLQPGAGPRSAAARSERADFGQLNALRPWELLIRDDDGSSRDVGPTPVVGKASDILRALPDPTACPLEGLGRGFR